MTNESNALVIQPENIPAELKERPRWVGWRFEKKIFASGVRRDEEFVSCGAEPKKIRINSQKKFVTFGEAIDCYRAGTIDGLGFAASAEDGFVVIRLSQIDKTSIGRLDSYTEHVNCGDVHVIARGKLPRGHWLTSRRPFSLVVSGQQFITISGVLWPQRGEGLFGHRPRKYPPPPLTIQDRHKVLARAPYAKVRRYRR